MLQFTWKLSLAAIATSLTLWGTAASAQTELRQGILQLNQVEALSERPMIVSEGLLAELQVDPYFDGDFQTIYNQAAGILEGYTVVNRGGGFPENAGIPLAQQLTQAEVVYTIFLLDDGNELFLYRSPLENTARYFIRMINGM